ncbi:MAG: glycosyltransferase family 2 protein, partial [Mycoplasma sp.]
MKKITIAVTIFNTDLKLLDDCIKSIDKQKNKEFILLLINNGSDKFISKYLSSLKLNIEYNIINLTKNLGFSSGRQTAIEMCKTDYIAFVDSDDTISEEYMENFYSAYYKVKNDNKFDLCFIKWSKINGDFVQSNSIFKTNKKIRKYSYGDLFKYSAGWTKIISMK